MEDVEKTEKKFDLKDLAEVINKLPESEKLKIYYMVKGVELVSDKEDNKDSA